MNFNSANLNNLEVLLQNETLTTDGAVQVTLDTSEYKEFYFTVRVDGPVTGVAPTLQFTLYDQDLFQISVTGNATFSTVFTSPVLSQSYKHDTQTGLMQLNWTITGTTPSFGGVYAAITGIKDAFITGQATMDQSTPVVIASDQSPIPITGTVTTSPNVNIHDAAGNNLTSQVNGAQRALDVGINVAGVQIDPRAIRALTSGTDSVTSIQGTSPWVISGTVTQGTSPWVVSGTVAATQSGTWTVQQGTPPWSVSQSGVWTTGRTWALASGTDSVSAVQSGTWNINNISGTISLPTGAATSANQTTEITSLQILDDGVNAFNTVFSKAYAIGAQLDDTGTTVATEENIAPLRITAQRGLHTNLRNTAGTEIATSANPLRIDPTGTTTQPVNVNNTAGASAVNIQDGGNSITVDGSLGRTWTLASGTDSVTANISQWGGSSTTLGQKTMANSVPVVLASDQSTINTTTTLTDGSKATYSAAVTGLATAAASTDIFTLTGSGTKTIRILSVNITGTRTTSTTHDVLLIKRSTANSGGTSTNLTEVPHDSNSAAATATALSYTTNPTLGTTIGTIRSEKMFVNSLGAGASDPLHWEFGNGPSQAVVLRGTGEVFAVNFNGATVTTPSFDVDITWTEE